MAGKAKCVYIHLFHIYRNDSCGLSAVYKELKTVLFAYSADFCKRVDRTADVACVSHDNGFCLRPDHAFDSIEHQLAFLGSRDPVKSDSGFFELNERPHHSIVLHGRAENVIARSEKTFQYDIERLGYILGKDNILAVAAAEHFRKHLARLKNGAFKIVGSFITAAVDIGTAFCHIFIDSIRYFSRLRKRSRAIIQIDFVHISPLYSHYFLSQLYFT